jgi:alcohol dehydrogenase
MGSMTVPLSLSYSEIMRNDWEIIGQFMYPSGAYRRLIAMLRSGLLDISRIRPITFPLEALPEAADAEGSEPDARWRGRPLARRGRQAR